MRLGLIGGELDHVLLAVGLGPVLKLAMPAGGIGGELEHVEVLEGPGHHGLDLPARHAPILAGALGALPDLQHEEVAVQRASDQGGRITGIGAVEAEHHPLPAGELALGGPGSPMRRGGW